MKRKYELNLYAPFQYEDIQVHLEEMAERGWELEKASYRLFTYRSAEPSPVRYALAYRPEVGWMDQLPTQGQAIYADYCQDAGWELVDTWARYPQIQIYRSRMRYPVPLETDLTTHWQVLTTWMERRYVEPLRSYVAIGSLIAIFTALLLTIFLTQGGVEPPWCSTSWWSWWMPSGGWRRPAGPRRRGPPVQEGGCPCPGRSLCG